MLYCHPPPGVSEDIFNVLEERLNAVTGSTKKKVEPTVRHTEGDDDLDDLVMDLDTEDFQVGQTTDCKFFSSLSYWLANDDFDKRIKPKGRKAQKREKERLMVQLHTSVLIYEAENAAYHTTDGKQKRGGKIATKHRGGARGGSAGRQGAFPTGVKMTSTTRSTVIVQPTK